MAQTARATERGFALCGLRQTQFRRIYRALPADRLFTGAKRGMNFRVGLIVRVAAWLLVPMATAQAAAAAMPRLVRALMRSVLPAMGRMAKAMWR
jgi:hypothetical protein